MVLGMFGNNTLTIPRAQVCFFSLSPGNSDPGSGVSNLGCEGGGDVGSRTGGATGWESSSFFGVLSSLGSSISFDSSPHWVSFRKVQTMSI